MPINAKPVPFATHSGSASFRLKTLRIAGRVAFSVALFLAFLAFAARSVHATPQLASAERALFDATNHERVMQGLPALRWDSSLANAARAHALLMAERSTLSHQFSGEPPVQDRARQAGARFSVIAENVAQGPAADTIHSSWMHSPPHRANILDRELTAIGIAVVSAADRNSGGAQLFAVQDFSQSVAPLSYDQQEQQVSALLSAQGLQLIDARSDARKTCEMDRGWSGSRPGAVVRYEEPDLGRLPDDLEQKVRSGKYRAATVGACDPGGSRGFTRFRVAVLLF